MPGRSSRLTQLAAGVTGLFVLAGVGASAGIAAAQTQTQAPPGAKPPANVSGVTVTARSGFTAAQQVEALGQADGKGQLARWSTPICPAAMGLPGEFDAFIVSRIREVAAQSGVKTAPEACQANVVVMVTRDPAAFTRRLVTLKEHALAGGRWPIDKVKLEAFANDTRPVRWLYMSDTVQSSGGEAATAAPRSAGISNGRSDGPHGLEAFLGAGALPSAPQFGNVHPSRLTPTGEQAFSQIVIVVDADRIAGLDAGQLSDYLSMVALAQIRSDATFVGINTVLNLFSPDRDPAQRPAGLTDWDTAYLKALYGSDSQSSYAAQVSHIATRMKVEQATANGGR
jgi:hypothetical protein